MRETTKSNTYAVADVRLALSEIYSDSTYDAVPAVNQYDPLEAYRADDDGGLDELPQALAAYVDLYQRQWL